MTLEELKATMKSTAAEVVEAALAPMREKQAAYSARMFAGEGARTNEPPVTKGTNAFRTVVAVAAANKDREKAISFAKECWGDGPVLKALSTADFGAGGALLPATMSSDFIEFLREQSVFLARNPIISKTELPISFAKMVGGTVASFIAENAAKPVTQPEFGDITLNPKEIAAVTPISNKLLRATNGNAEEIVRNDLAAAVQFRIDLAFIRGNGLQDTPKGILNWAPAANKIPATQAGAVATVQEVTTDLSKLRLALRKGLSRMIRPAWFWGPRTTEFLRSMRDGNNNLVWAEQINAGRLFGAPFGETTQIPDTLGGGANESEIYLVDMADIIVGEAPQILVDSSTEASYVDGAGVTHSCYQKNQTLIRISSAYDLIPRHDASIVVLTGVKWGA